MSVETEIKDLLNPLVAGGCYNTVNDSGSNTPPYVVFYEISGDPEVGLNESYLGTTRYRYQVDVFAASPEAAKGIALQIVKPALTGSTELEAQLIFQMAGQFSDLDKTYQYITEYSIWAA